jgi:hypothetical protein
MTQIHLCPSILTRNYFTATVAGLQEVFGMNPKPESRGIIVRTTISNLMIRLRDQKKSQLPMIIEILVEIFCFRPCDYLLHRQRTRPFAKEDQTEVEDGFGT